MKPAELDLGHIEAELRSRSQAMERNQRLEVLKNRKSNTVDRIWHTIDGLKELYENADPHQSRVIILETRQDERVGYFFIVGRVQLSPLEPETDQTATAASKKGLVQFGVAFTPKLGVRSGHESLGLTISGQEVYGNWLAEESTAEVDLLLNDAANSHSNNQLNACAVKLESMEESIDTIDEAAHNVMLNRPERKFLFQDRH